MSGIVFILILLVLMVPLFLTTRRQKKMMRQTQETQRNLTVGDVVMTSSGLHGVITGLDETSVEVEIADGVVTRWERVAIRERISDNDDDDSDDNEDADDEYGEVTDGSEEFSDDDFSDEDFSADDLTPEDFGSPETRMDSELDATAGSLHKPENESPRRDGGVAEP